MTALNDIFGSSIELPSNISGIRVSEAPTPHEGANGLYVLGPELNGFPTYYFGTYVIANLYGSSYALYHEDFAFPDGDNEIWQLGPEGTGPVSPGLLVEPFPVVVAEGTVDSGGSSLTLPSPEENSTASLFGQVALNMPPAASNQLAFPEAWSTSLRLPSIVDGVDELYTIGGGSYNTGETPGQFLRSGDDCFQGLVTSLPVTELINDAEFLRAEFFWSGGGANNAGQQVLFGFFDGPMVNADNQLTATDQWNGYFFALGTRLNTDGDTPYGIYWQGPGELPIFNHILQDSFPVFTVNGMGSRVTSGFRPPLRNDALNKVVLTIKRLSVNQLEFSVFYRTPHSDGSQNATFSGLGREVQVNTSASGHEGTIRSVWKLPEQTPMRFSGLALAANQNFVMTGLNVQKGSPSVVPFDLNNLPVSSSMPSISAGGLPAASILPSLPVREISFDQSLVLPGADPGQGDPASLQLPPFPSRSLLDISSGIEP